VENPEVSPTRMSPSIVRSDLPYASLRSLSEEAEAVATRINRRRKEDS
jgi:hypothetical protein